MTPFLRIVCIFFFAQFNCLAQEDSLSKTHDAATENIAEVLFNTRAKPIRQRLNAFENGNGIKIQYRVENQSLDKLGGLSEHLFKLFQNFTSTQNANVNMITAEFSALQNSELSDKLRYETFATSDLTSCRLPLKETDSLDSFFCKSLGERLLSAEETSSMPEGINEIYEQSIDAYQTILYNHSDCPGVYNSNSYNQHVAATRQKRIDNWASDAAHINTNITLRYGLLTSSSSHSTTVNSTSPCVNCAVTVNTAEGEYMVDLNNSVGDCPQNDLDFRCRMLYNKTGVNYFFVTQTLKYFIPTDSLNKFRDLAVQSFSNNLSDKFIFALCLKMEEEGNSEHSSVLLVKQLNGNWLTKADINFANYNNSGTNYESGISWRFANLYKNIPKPLILCYQVAKVNGLLTTAYFYKGEAVKGKEQIYIHVLKLDKAFEEIFHLRQQVENQENRLKNTEQTARILDILTELRSLNNKIKLCYVKSAKTPEFRDAEINFKEQYLQKKEFVEAAALRHIKDLYDDHFTNDRIETLIAKVGLPTDIAVGSCPQGGSSDIIAESLNIASLILAPTGFDFVADALAVAYFLGEAQFAQAAEAGLSFVLPEVVRGLKIAVNGIADGIKAMNIGSKLLLDGKTIVAAKQDDDLITGLFHINPKDVSASLITKINDNPTAVNELLLLPPKSEKLLSHVSSELSEAKRSEFLIKAFNEPNWRQKVLDDPDEVLRWAGLTEGLIKINPKEIRNAALNWDVNKKTKFDLADNFYDKSGYTDYDNHLRGIDYDEDVSKIIMESEHVMYQLATLDNAGNPIFGGYFFENELEDVTKLGIGNLSRISADGRAKVKVILNDEIEFLHSKAADIEDWKNTGIIFKGGGNQYFNANAKNKIKSYEIIETY